MTATRIIVATFVATAVALAAPGVRAEAPAGRYAVAADTVKDLETGLTWQRVTGRANCTATEGATYCGALALDLGGWRLPTIRELQTLVDFQHVPAIDLGVFPDTSAGSYWSSTPFTFDKFRKWTVNFRYGERYAAASSTSLGAVRCVK